MNSTPINRTQISIIFQSNNLQPTKDNSVVAFSAAVSKLNLNPGEKLKLAELTKFVSIGMRMEHYNNLNNKYKIFEDKVKTRLEAIGVRDNSEELAKHLINFASISSPKKAGFKELFLGHHTMSQHAKNFITDTLNIRLSDMDVRSTDIDNVLRGGTSTKPGLNELLAHFQGQLNLFTEERGEQGSNARESVLFLHSSNNSPIPQEIGNQQYMSEVRNDDVLGVKFSTSVDKDEENKLDMLTDSQCNPIHNKDLDEAAFEGNANFTNQNYIGKVSEELDVAYDKGFEGEICFGGSYVSQQEDLACIDRICTHLGISDHAQVKNISDKYGLELSHKYAIFKTPGGIYAVNKEKSGKKPLLLWLREKDTALASNTLNIEDHGEKKPFFLNWLERDVLKTKHGTKEYKHIGAGQEGDVYAREYKVKKQDTLNGPNMYKNLTKEDFCNINEKSLAFQEQLAELNLSKYIVVPILNKSRVWDMRKVGSLLSQNQKEEPNWMFIRACKIINEEIGVKLKDIADDFYHDSSQNLEHNGYHLELIDQAFVWNNTNCNEPQWLHIARNMHLFEHKDQYGGGKEELVDKYGYDPDTNQFPDNRIPQPILDMVNGTVTGFPGVL